MDLLLDLVMKAQKDIDLLAVQVFEAALFLFVVCALAHSLPTLRAQIVRVFLVDCATCADCCLDMILRFICALIVSIDAYDWLFVQGSLGHSMSDCIER